MTGSWTSEEDAKLTSAVANTSKKKWGNEYKIDWVERERRTNTRERSKQLFDVGLSESDLRVWSRFSACVSVFDVNAVNNQCDGSRRIGEKARSLLGGGIRHIRIGRAG
jgi:hypothetical protein